MSIVIYSQVECVQRIILDILKEEILQYVAIKNQTLTINDILEINSKERTKDKRQKDKLTNTVFLVKGHNNQT
ncbi:MAG TPA: hypothetical protein VI278_07185 [Nitrososphaeraceae archaeon]